MSVTGALGEFRTITSGRGFRRLLASRLTSQVSDGWFQAGLAGSLLFNPEKQASATAIAAGFAILLLPYSALGPFVGVFLDRWDRRASLTVSNLLRAALVLPAAGLLWAGLQGTGFALFALLVIAVNRFFLAGLGAALPHVVEDERLVAANAIATTLGTVSYAAGLVSAAALLGTPMITTDRHGYALIAILGSAGYLVSALLLWVLFTPGVLGPDDGVRRRDSIWSAIADVARGVGAGLAHLAQRRPAGYAVLVQAGHRALFGILSLATLLLFSRYFTTDESRSISNLGLVVLAGGVGALVAAVLTPIATRRFSSRHYVSLLLGATGPVLLVLGPPFQPVLLLLGVFLLNVASQGTKIVVDATLQHECDDAYRGRVFSINDTAFNGTFVAGLFAGAWLLPANGKSLTAVVLVAVGYGALALWYVTVTGRVREPVH
jgi:MFS family permease